VHFHIKELDISLYTWQEFGGLSRASAGNFPLQCDACCLQYDPICSRAILDEMAIDLAIHVADAIPLLPSCRPGI
jgi:hypothetical protein